MWLIAAERTTGDLSDEIVLNGRIRSESGILGVLGAVSPIEGDILMNAGASVPATPAEEIKGGKIMEDTRVPYIVYEGAQAKNERTVKRLVIALVIAISLIFVSNMAWLYVWSGYDYTSTDVTTTQMYKQDGEGVNIIGSQNEVKDGASTDHSNQEPNKDSNK